MATIYGRTSYWGGHRNDRFDDQLIGTSGDDYVSGLGGNDSIFSGRGNDTVLGGNGDDYIDASDTSQSVAAWGNDSVWGGAGNDTINYMQTTSAVTLVGDAGEDTIYGGSSGDSIYGGSESDIVFGNAGSDFVAGGAGDDYLSGGSGGDTLRGESGVDEIIGGAGNDRIIGGATGDWLTGGVGADLFIYETPYESGLLWETADTIMDFSEGDRLDFAVAGGANNFVDTYLYSGSDFNTARDWAAEQISSGARYAFASGPTQEGTKGYLFADSDGNGTMDTGIELLDVRAGSLFYWHIV